VITLNRQGTLDQQEFLATCQQYKQQYSSKQTRRDNMGFAVMETA
jgi:hypothetical protein